MSENLLKPYPYWKNILSPSQLGMSSNGSLATLGTDIDGLVQYVEVLVTGRGASATGQPLGNKFFLPTNTKCKDINSGELKNRYSYVNNVPDGHIPFISSAMGENFTSFEGLIPGVLENIEGLDPFAIFKSFTMGENPPCKEVTLEVIDNNNNTSEETHYVALADLNEGFTNIGMEQQKQNSQFLLPTDNLVNLYFICLMLLLIYLVFKMVQK